MNLEVYIIAVKYVLILIRTTKIQNGIQVLIQETLKLWGAELFKCSMRDT